LVAAAKFLVAATKNLFVVPSFVAVKKNIFFRDNQFMVVATNILVVTTTLLVVATKNFDERQIERCIKN